MSTTFAQRRCLVLNKSWAPVGIVPLEKAVKKLVNFYPNGEPKARIIDPQSYQAFTWSDWSKLRLVATDEKINAGSMFFRIPEVILLTHYDKIPQPKVHFSRRNLFKRDEGKCQYCGKQPKSDEWSIDHVIPRSRGGETVWENVVLSCLDCNRKKADRSLKESGLKLHKIPKKPFVKFLHFGDIKPIKSWRSFISEAYWSVELDNENS